MELKEFTQKYTGDYIPKYNNESYLTYRKRLKFIKIARNNNLIFDVINCSTELTIDKLSLAKKYVIPFIENEDDVNDFLKFINIDELFEQYEDCKDCDIIYLFNTNPDYQDMDLIFQWYGLVRDETSEYDGELIGNRTLTKKALLYGIDGIKELLKNGEYSLNYKNAENIINDSYAKRISDNVETKIFLKTNDMKDKKINKEKPNNKILIINTGGTFNKEYNEITGELIIKQNETKIQEILTQCKISNKGYELIGTIYKDSLQINKQDREKLLQLILNKIKKDKFSKIIIVHGTDTINKTAQYIYQKLNSIINNELFHKIDIVLTAAMKPYSINNIEATGNFMLSYGFLKNKILKEETTIYTKKYKNNRNVKVYIAMHGLVNTFGKIKKNYEKGIFEEI